MDKKTGIYPILTRVGKVGHRAIGTNFGFWLNLVNRSSLSQTDGKAPVGLRDVGLGHWFDAGQIGATRQLAVRLGHRGETGALVKLGNPTASGAIARVRAVGLGVITKSPWSDRNPVMRFFVEARFSQG